jgi:hypothetical protein
MLPITLGLARGWSPIPVSITKITSRGSRHKQFAWVKQTLFATFTSTLLYGPVRFGSASAANKP